MIKIYTESVFSATRSAGACLIIHPHKVIGQSWCFTAIDAAEAKLIADCKSFSLVWSILKYRKHKIVVMQQVNEKYKRACCLLANAALTQGNGHIFTHRLNHSETQTS